jgi:hypothetical protein
MTAMMVSGALAGGGPPPPGPPGPRDTIGVVRGLGTSDPVWYLRRSNDESCPPSSSVYRIGQFGGRNDQVLSIDTSGDSVDQIAVFRDEGGNGIFYIRKDNYYRPNSAPPVISVPLGAGTDIPVVGNFDSTDDGDEIGVYRPSTNEFFLDDGMPNLLNFPFGTTGDIPVAGNWDGAGGTRSASTGPPKTLSTFAPISIRAPALP